ncbi:MAG: 3-oxoacyl-[acyl-carrier-protein] synthase III C-terminal domain-containing protein [Verrucomicrobiota bacterium]
MPSTRYRQTECWETLQSSGAYHQLAPRSQALLRKVLLGRNGIEARHLSLDRLEDAFVQEHDALHQRFSRNAPALATSAAEHALKAAGIGAGDIDAVLVATCTGYLCPGLTSHVTERLGLSPRIFALDLVGLGCGAAVPVLRTAQSILAAGNARTVLCICVEVSSAAFYLDDDPGVLISACLFGDGAAAAICTTAPPTRGRSVRWISSASDLTPADREALRLETRGGRLRNILTPQVPALAGERVTALCHRMLTDAGLPRTEIREWILHPGGRDVLIALQTGLGLAENDLRHSASVLRIHGNMSSPCVLFALRSALEENTPDGWWWLSSFGAGFSCHGALLQVDSSLP